MVLLKDISFESFCEHHMVPFVGKMHISYIPDGRVVGLSKLARVADVFAKRLQTQERMTSEIALCIDKTLKPKGTAVIIYGHHQCMSMRGVHKPSTTMCTQYMTGLFRENKDKKNELFKLINSSQ